MRREVVPRRAYGAAPVFEPEVNLAMRVKHSLALLAEHRLILHERHPIDLLERCVDGSNRHDDTSLCDLVAGPIIPGEPQSILVLSLIEVHLF